MNAETNAITITDEHKILTDKARELIAERSFDDAMSHLARALSLIPESPEVFNLLGAVIEMNGDVLKAQKFYRAALSLDPTYIPAQKNLERTASWRREGQIIL